MKELGKILVDSPADVDTSVAVEFLERLGHPVDLCQGPTEEGGCPILVGEHCPMMEEATGVVFSFDLDRADHRSILAKYQEMLPAGMPIRVVVQPGQEAAYRQLLAGVQVWTHSPTVGELDGFAAQVEAAED